jgi:hypothetical protein
MFILFLSDSVWADEIVEPNYGGVQVVPFVVSVVNKRTRKGITGANVTVQLDSRRSRGLLSVEQRRFINNSAKTNVFGDSLEYCVLSFSKSSNEAFRRYTGEVEIHCEFDEFEGVKKVIKMRGDKLSKLSKVLIELVPIGSR